MSNLERLLATLDDEQLVAWDRDVCQGDILHDDAWGVRPYRTKEVCGQDTERVTVSMGHYSSVSELYYLWDVDHWRRVERWCCTCGAHSSWKQDSIFDPPYWVAGGPRPAAYVESWHRACIGPTVAQVPHSRGVTSWIHPECARLFTIVRSTGPGGVAEGPRRPGTGRG